jgi:hypothetical protein
MIRAFAWYLPEPDSRSEALHGPFAPSPLAFRHSRDIVPDEMRPLGQPYAMTNMGVQNQPLHQQSGTIDTERNSHPIL